MLEIFILVYQVPKVIFYFKLKRWLQLSSCGMTHNTPTMVPWCLQALLAASIITCLPGIDNHLLRELLSPSGRYLPSLSIPHGDWLSGGQLREQCFLFLNPPIPRGPVLRKSIRPWCPLTACLKSGGVNGRESARWFDRCQTSTF